MGYFFSLKKNLFFWAYASRLCFTILHDMTFSFIFKTEKIFMRFQK